MSDSVCPLSKRTFVQPLREVSVARTLPLHPSAEFVLYGRILQLNRSGIRHGLFVFSGFRHRIINAVQGRAGDDFGSRACEFHRGMKEFVAVQNLLRGCQMPLVTALERSSFQNLRKIRYS